MAYLTIFCLNKQFFYLEEESFDCRQHGGVSISEYYNERHKHGYKQTASEALEELLCLFLTNIKYL